MYYRVTAILFAFSLLFSANYSFAQVELTGSVSDAETGERLIGATVVVSGGG